MLLFSYGLWEWSLVRSMDTIESIWSTWIATVLPRLIWNSLERSTLSSLQSSLHSSFTAKSASTAYRLGTMEETPFMVCTISFLVVAGIYTEPRKKELACIADLMWFQILTRAMKIIKALWIQPDFSYNLSEIAIRLLITERRSNVEMKFHQIN